MKKQNLTEELDRMKKLAGLINESQDDIKEPQGDINERNTLDYYIAQALKVEPREDKNGLHYHVQDSDNDYTLIFNVDIIDNKREEIFYGNRRMYFREDSYFTSPSEELTDLIEGEISMSFKGDFKYNVYNVYWSSETYDITGELSENTKKDLTTLFDNLAEGSFEDYIYNQDDDTDNYQASLRWSNPNL